MFDVVLPLKALPEAKSRLAEVLTDSQRRELMLAMAQDVVAALLAWSDCRSLTILQGTGWPPRLPMASKLRVIREGECGGVGLNEILTAGIDKLVGGRVVVVFGDLPGLAAADLKALRTAFDEGNTVICPDDQNVGTNALAFSVQNIPVFRFGGNSLREYGRNICSERCVVLERPGLSFDVDTPAGLYALLWGRNAAMSVGPATQKWVQAARRSGVMWRIQVPVSTQKNAGVSW
ncbi:MAG: 2-phospho-L-lactate guanylyltransferase [Luminiphilus sp.]|nr:2-phospho-L-lactate guanylyltransferase [Luminiphilus sp.]